MKKVILSLVVIASVLTACKGEKKEEVAVKEEVKVVEVQELKNNLDLDASVLTWKGTKPTGAHDGIVSLKEGNLTVENGVLTSGEFVIDMNSITNLDMKGSDGAGKLEGHLKNADFFDVEKYPTSKFTITSVAKGENVLNVTGNLTVKDVTKSITIPATVSETDGVVTFKSEKFNINRADFNVKYGSKSFFDNLKDKFINDLMEMSFEVKTKA
ncbi:polyisoprenoid-binding protein [Tenacibaculum todarodis]|uniref:Polyisoprenoid-binding protein n=1 Tax=Tenacibaculum todarodis TaxID=1850252 RepID=A0A1L3JJJ4_9FLAO|nr:YceI family protein [Tenacibaculum todarodis]APG65298.1 polyisoprenoid-binding protein [Tenacibaculum todarodis]